MSFYICFLFIAFDLVLLHKVETSCTSLLIAAVQVIIVVSLFWIEQQKRYRIVKCMTSYRCPGGSFSSKEEYLEAFKKINNIEYIEEDVFLDCLVQEDYEPYKAEDRYYPPLSKKFYWNTQKVQPKMRKRSIVRDAKILLMTLLVKITNRFVKWMN